MDFGTCLGGGFAHGHVWWAGAGVRVWDGDAGLRSIACGCFQPRSSRAVGRLRRVQAEKEARGIEMCSDAEEGKGGC